MRAGEIAVELRGVGKVYGRGALATTALADVDLEVRTGELTMLVGPSGSGKTTLLSIVGCVLSPTSGRARLFGEQLDGRDEKELPALRVRYVGFIFQQFNLLPALTSCGNVELPLLLRGTDPREAKKRALTVLREVGLITKADRKPRDLSGGEQQRVAIARAIAARPPLVLADEPTASLDGHRGLQIVEMLRDLAHDRGHAVLVVTHDSRVFHLADRIVHIEDGRIVDAPKA